MKKFLTQKSTMYNPHSSRNNQRTNPHSEALPSKKTGLPAQHPERVRKKACTEDVNKTRAKPRRPDMKLYVPRARRSQTTPETSFSSDVHSSERVQSTQIDSKCSDITFGMIQDCSSSVANIRQSNCEEKDHLLQYNILHQEDQPETGNLIENDNLDFNRSFDCAKNVNLPASQFLQKYIPKSILYTNSIEDKKNILNVQDDCDKIILNQNSSILSERGPTTNLCQKVPDFDCNEFTNQKEKIDTAEHSHVGLHINSCEIQSDLSSSRDYLESSVVDVKLDNLTESKDVHIEEILSSENDMQQSELTETKGLSSDILSEDSDQFQTNCNALCVEQEFSAGQKSIFVNKEKHATENDTGVIQCKNDCFLEAETKKMIHCEENNLDRKSSEDFHNVSVPETSTRVDLSIESMETKTTLDSSDAVDMSSKSANDDSWDSMFDDSGECLNPEILKELTTAMGNVKITKSKYNYYEFQPHEPDVSGEEFGHIVEFYDFPAEFKNQDLLTIISAFKNEAFNIKWVDDTHALGVFSSPLAAMEALSLNHPLLKVRPLSQGIRESKFKAKRCAEFLQPYRPRPETSATIARRLVSGALGVKVQIPKEQRELEKKRLKEARDKRRQAAKQKQDIWDGVVS